jgi:uncharacterized protein
MDAVNTIICVFAKPARPGLAKTRLIGRHGPQEAADLARAFFVDTWNAVSALPWARAIVATTDPGADQWDSIPRSSVWSQGPGDLGDRLERIMRRALTQAEIAIAIGADTPGLPEKLLLQARHTLVNADAVLGPASDGGFYLAGLKGCPAGLFADLPWSCEETLALTRERLVTHRMDVQLIDPWFDVDRPEDVERLRQLLVQGAIEAPVTARLLAADPHQHGET